MKLALNDCETCNYVVQLRDEATVCVVVVVLDCIIYEVDIFSILCFGILD